MWPVILKDHDSGQFNHEFDFKFRVAVDSLTLFLSSLSGQMRKIFV